MGLKSALPPCCPPRFSQFVEASEYIQLSLEGNEFFENLIMVTPKVVSFRYGITSMTELSGIVKNGSFSYANARKLGVDLYAP